jgi:diaminopimelate decarboxylase
MSLFALDEEEALEAAERFGTPCFVYRLDTAIASFDALRSVLPERAILAYAVKANPGAPLIKAFASRGAWFDCASSGELERVAAAQVPGGRILFAGPGKTEAELALAVSMGARIQVDGIEDLERLEALLAASPQSAASGGPLRLSLRVHPASGVSESSRIIGGSGPSVFGVDEEELLPFLAETRRFERLRITGLQVFAASNEREAERLLGNYRRTFEIARLLSREVGALELIDLGGGLGIPYDESESELDIMALGSGLVRILADNPWFEGHVIVEPGRFLAGPCGVYLARVIRTKLSRGTRFVVLEGGVNHLLRPLLTGRAFPASLPGKTGPLVPCTLAGPLCTSLDRLGDVRIPEPQAGDIVMLGQAGAYGFTESMNAFLSHPQAAEIWLEESLLRRGRA